MGHSGQFKPGQSGNPDGRPKGSKNKASKLKEAYVAVFEELGGPTALKKWVESDEKNKSDFYKMLPQLMPREQNVTIDTELSADDRALQAAHEFFRTALGNKPESSGDRQPETLPH